MTVLPIVDRELRVAARKRGTYLARTAMGLAAITVAAMLQISASGMPAADAGQRIFRGLLWIAFVYCLFAGRRSTADCLSWEKREGTLGILFLTDLKGYDVVLGKLAATSLNGFYGLLAVLPVMAIPMLLGGVTSGEFWRVVLVLVLTFLLSLAAGILVSALSRDSRRAFGANLLLLIGIIGIPPAIGASLSLRWPALSFPAPLFYSCPAYTLNLAKASVYQSNHWSFWASAAVIHGMTWAMVLLASSVVPRSWQDRTTASSNSSVRTVSAWARVKRWLFFWRRQWQKDPAHRSGHRRALLERGAYYWLAARGRLKRAQVWVLFAAIAGWWVWTQAKYGQAWQTDVLNPLNITAALMINTALKIWICIEAGRQLAEDRRSGAFELLLSTPLEPREILRGQWRALIRQFFWPLVAAIGVELLFLFDALRHTVTTQPAATMATTLWLSGLIMLMLDVLALAQVGMWTGLTARSANQATVGALIRVLLIPWLVVWAVSASVSFSAPMGTRLEWTFFLGCWFWSGVAADMFFGLIARFQLLERFRELAVQPHSHRASWPRLAK